MDWKEIVKSIAPVIGTALGGPMMGGTVRYLASTLLGDDNASEKDVAAYIQNANPDQLLDIKQLDNDFKIKMEKLGVDVFKLEVADRSSARVEHKHSRMPTVICILLTFMVSAGAYNLMVTVIPEDNSDILHMLFGQVLTAWTASIAYWVGTTRSSSDKSKMLGINK
jgi:hypothetical protein|tara:strand:+ start:2431 stop:2931 length:501 start_codon:yes stop_codon:yes gene_type:complete